MGLLSDLYKKVKPVASFVQNEANALNQKRLDAGNYLNNQLNPVTGNGFAGQAVDRANTFIQSGQKVQAPEWNVGDSAPFVKKVVPGAYNLLARPIINSGLNLSANLGLDVGQNLAGQVRTPGAYRSNLANLTGRLTDVAAGNTQRPQDILGDFGSTAMDFSNMILPENPRSSLISAAKGNFGKTAQMGALRELAATGAKFGGRLGLVQGAAGGLEANRGASVPDQLKAGATGALVSGVAGATLGAATPYVGAGVNELGYQAKQEFLNPVRKPGFAKLPTFGSNEPLSPVTKERGFITSSKDATNLNNQVKDALSGTYNVKKNSQLVADVGNQMATEGTYAMQNRLMSTPASKFSDQDVAASIALAHLHNVEGNYQAAADVIQNLAPKLTQAGRSVQAASLLDRLTPEGVQYLASKELSKIGKALDPVAAQKLAEQAKIIRGMADGKAKNIAINDMMTGIKDLVPSSGWDKLMTVWKAGLLTSPKTTMRNLVGNTVNAAAEFAKDPIATLSDGLMSLATGQRTQTTTMRGTVSGAIEGFGKAKDVIQHGFDPNQAMTKFDVNHITWGKNPIEQGLKMYTDTIFRTLEAQDKPFYESAFKRSLYDQAGAASINAGKRGDGAFIENLVNNPTPDMVTTAHQDASIATFKNQTAATKIINNAKQAAKAHSPAVGAALDFIAPFTGVPTSVAGQMISYSPFGLAKGLYNATKVVVNPKNFGSLQRQAAQEIGRGVVGTGVMALGAELMNRGLMTGDYPTDTKTQEQWKLDGRQPNSILVNGKWRAINSIGPQASMLLVGGKMGVKDQLDANGNPVNKVAQTASSMGKTVSDASFLSGIQGVLDAVNDPTQNASKLVNSSVSGIVPNAVRDIAKGTDVNNQGNMIGRESNNPIQAFKNGVPGLRQQQLPQRTVFGDQVTNGKGLPSNAFDIFNSRPAVTNDPVTNELQRLNGTDTSATPSKLQARQTVFGNKLVMTPEQLDQFEQSTGAQVKQQFAQLMASPLYQSASDEEKAKALNNLTTSIRDSSKKQLYVNNQTTRGIKEVSPGNTLVNNQIGGTSNVGSTTNSTKPPTKEELDLAKYLVESGQKDSTQVGDTYIYRDSATGNVSTKKLSILKKDAESQKLINDIETAKRSDNYSKWVGLQQQKYNGILAKINSADPVLDQANVLKWQNAQKDIIANVSKYRGYGGAFTKPKKAKAPKKVSIKSPKLKLSTSTTKLRSSGLPKISKPKNISMKVKLPKVTIKQPSR